MDLTPYVDKLRTDLATAADAGGDEARALADRLTAPLESAVRLTLLQALSAAADEITRELAPGSVDVRLHGLDPSFVVTPDPGVRPRAEEPAAPAPVEDPGAAGDKGEMVRINLRLPDDLKSRIEEAAARDRISVNAWLVRAAAGALDIDGGAAPRPSAPRGRDEGRRFTGWVR
jgi:hypothetical protein